MVNLTFSSTNGGPSISSLSHGNGSAGGTIAAQAVYIRHDGSNSITNCRIYIAQKSGSYTGGATAAQDYQEMLDWGDGSDAAHYGGLQLNFNNAGSFPDGDWPVQSNKTPTKGDTVRTGRGDFLDTAIIIPVAAGCPSTGVVPAGSAPGVAFKCRFVIPPNETTLGNRQIDFKVRYTYTS